MRCKLLEETCRLLKQCAEGLRQFLTFRGVLILVQLICDITDLDQLAYFAIEQKVLYFELQNLFLRCRLYIIGMRFIKPLGIVLNRLRLTILLSEFVRILLKVVLNNFL